MRAEQIKSDIGGLKPSFFGLAFARAWLALLYANPLAQGYGPLYGTSIFDAAYSIAAIVVVLGFRRIIPLTGRRLWWAVPLACMEAATVLFAVDAAGIVPTHIAAMASSVVGGVGFLAYCLYNAEVLSTQPLRSIMLYLTLAPVLGVILMYFLMDVGFDRVLVALFALPAVAVCMSVRALGYVPPRFRPSASCPHFTMPWLLVGLLSVYAFVYGLHSASLTPGIGRYSVAAAGLILAVWVLGFSNRVNFRALYSLPALLIAAGLVLISVRGFISGVVTDLLVAIAFGVAGTVVAFMFYDMGKRLDISIVALSALYAATSIFSVAGRVMAEIIGSIPAENGVTMGVTYAGIVVTLLILVFVSMRRDFSQWGIRLMDEVPERLSVDEGRVAERCRAFSAEHGLSAREAEVLQLVAEGKTSREVQDILFIAEGTFKTHMRHIYEKSGVRGQKRLRYLLGVDAEGGSASEH